jgi:hypothetical protein
MSPSETQPPADERGDEHEQDRDREDDAIAPPREVLDPEEESPS